MRVICPLATHSRTAKSISFSAHYINAQFVWKPHIINAS